ncbi:MAG: hypothetical protein ACYCUV_07320 [Phycisphaerae bacterium]
MKTIKHSLLLAAVTAAGTACVGLPVAHAALLAYEPFNYTAGSNLVGQAPTSPGFGFGAWQQAGAADTVQSGSLVASSSYGGYSTTAPSLATAGNSLSVSSAGGVDGAAVSLTTPRAF